MSPPSAIRSLQSSVFVDPHRSSRRSPIANHSWLFGSEQVLARLEDAVLPGLGGLGGCRGLGLGLEVGEVGLAEGALDDLEVELEVGGQVGVEGVEQVAAELLAARAGQPGAVPDGAQGVELAVAAVLADVLEPGAELGRVAQGLLDPGRVLGGQGVGQVVAEHGVVDRGRRAGREWSRSPWPRGRLGSGGVVRAGRFLPVTSPFMIGQPPPSSSRLSPARRAISLSRPIVWNL